MRYFSYFSKLNESTDANYRNLSWQEYSEFLSDKNQLRREIWSDKDTEYLKKILPKLETLNHEKITSTDSGYKIKTNSIRFYLTYGLIADRLGKSYNYLDIFKLTDEYFIICIGLRKERSNEFATWLCDEMDSIATCLKTEYSCKL